MTTLNRERRKKFEEIVRGSEFFKECELQWKDEYLEARLSELVTALADAAASRTEAQPSFTIGADQLSWDLYNAIKETKYMGVKVRTKLRDVLEEKIGKEDNMRNKQWDGLHDVPSDIAKIVDRLERALGLRNMMRDERAVEVYQWIAEQESTGKTIAKFADWALQPERAQFVGKYKKTPEAIKTDWQIAFENKHRSSADDEGI